MATQTIPRHYGDTINSNIAGGTAIPADASVTAAKLAAGAVAVGNTAIAAGAVAHSQIGRTVANKSGGTLSAGTLVYISGYDTGLGAPTIAAADAKSINKRAGWVVIADIANNATGVVAKQFLSAANLNTNSASAVGSPVYSDTSNGTVGGWIVASPAYRFDVVGVVVVKSASVGQIYFDLDMVTQGTVIAGNQGDIVAASIGSAQIAATAVTGTQLSTAAATKILHKNLSTIATTGSFEVLFTAPVAGSLSLIELTGKDALATSDTNYLTWALTNKGQAGAGSTAMVSQAAGAATTKVTGGQALVPYGKCDVPLHATPANLVVAKGDTLAFTGTVTGTLANTVTEGALQLDFTFTT